MEYISDKYNGFKFNFEKTNVFLGANGAGKSTFLSEMRSRLHNRAGNKVVFIEGGRAIKIQASLNLNSKNFSQYSRLQSAMQQHENKLHSFLAGRVFDALMLLEKKGQEEKINHSDEVNKWCQDGSNGKCPQRKQPPLEKLFEMFNEIFPQITLTYNESQKQLIAFKNGMEYSPASFSDGEKQVFSILADFIELNDTYNIIIVDEPELNLHPGLAERIWALIENEYPNKTFIYATHSINFSLRKNVNTVYILSDDSEKITQLNDFADLNRTEVSAFLGGIPGIISTNKVIVTEGHEKSFDSIFYRWLVKDNSIEIYPAGGCIDVINIVEKSGLWQKISTKIKLAGIIDSDFRSKEFIDKFVKKDIIHLPFHEAESFLCLPGVITSIAEKIGSQEDDLSQDTVIDIIFSTLDNKKLFISSRRAFAKTKITLGVSLKRKILQDIHTTTDLLELIKEASEKEIKKAIEKCGEGNLTNYLNDEIKQIELVIADRDVAKALFLLPGKELLNILAPKAGCRNGDDLMRSLKRNFSPDDFKELSELQGAIVNVINS